MSGSIPVAQLANHAYVWIARPDDAAIPGNGSNCLSILSVEERARFGQFQFEQDRLRYLVAHALVRRALSNCSGSDPADWRFSTNEQGRPEIEAPNSVPPLRFNLTHTTELCACVVTLDRDCGIDAEKLSQRGNLRKIANRMFAPAEVDAIGDFSDDRSLDRFFRHWTLREAYLKALGVGLARSTRDFYFDADDGSRPQLNFVQGPGVADHWQFALVRPTDSHLVAIAIHRPDASDLNIVVRALDVCA
jgi:4'-phosphopantetheinyl transferase